MITKKKKKSKAVNFLEKLTGGPLTFSSLLEAIRQGEEMSQTAFAKKLSISRAHLCDIEKGRRFVSPDRAVKFARVLGYSETRFIKLALQDLLNRTGLDCIVEIRAA